MSSKRIKALLVLGSLVFALALCEVGLGLLGIEYPNFYEPDPHVGYKLRPGIKGYWLEEGGGYVSISSDGLRDKEHSIEKPQKTLRIAVLGDSYAEAKQVNREEAFWAIMEKDLQKCGKLRRRQVEVINFGKSGLGTTQELLALRHWVWKYSPNVVLLAFVTSNDIADNSGALMQNPQYDPFYSFQDGELVLHDQQTKKNWLVFSAAEKRMQKSWWERLKRRVEDNSRVYQLIRHAQMKALLRRDQISKSKQTAAVHKGQEPGLSIAIYRRPNQEAWQEAWKVTEAVLLLMRDEVAAKGARFFVAVLTNGPQVHPDPRVREKFARGLGVPDLLYPDHRLADFCQRHGIPILLLAPAFQEYVTKHQVFFHGFGDNVGTGHWNQSGHRLAGKMLAEWLCEQIN